MLWDDSHWGDAQGLQVSYVAIGEYNPCRPLYHVRQFVS
jgi:hypothetical protein